MDDLVLRLKKGDQNAFDELCLEFQQKIFSLCCSLCGNYDDALDITQDVLIKIYKGISSFKGDSSLSTWIYRITKNACYDFLRKNKKNPDEEIPDNFVSQSLTPEEMTIKNENIELVRKCIDKIPAKYKLPLILREYRQLSYSEIADILEISEGTVKSRIFRAREYLLKLISESGNFTL